MTRADALVALLAAPIPSNLVGLEAIGYAYKLPRHPDGACGFGCQRRDADGLLLSSDPWVIKHALGIAHVEHARQDWTDGDISCVVSVRKQPRLSMVKRSA